MGNSKSIGDSPMAYVAAYCWFTRFFCQFKNNKITTMAPETGLIVF
jgi:hypothetical protein